MIVHGSVHTCDIVGAIGTFWPQLISNLMVAPVWPVCNAASNWPCTFLHPRCFCLA